MLRLPLVLDLPALGLPDLVAPAHLTLEAARGVALALQGRASIGVVLAKVAYDEK